MHRLKLQPIFSKLPAQTKWRDPFDYKTSRFFENQPNEICSHLRDTRQKTGFMGPISSKITLTKEKERRKGKNKKEERRRRKKAMVALLVFFYNRYFGDKVWPKKSCWTQKVHLAVAFSKIRLDVYNYIWL